MNTCKTCKHWSGKVGGLQLPWRYIGDGPHKLMFETYGKCEWPNIYTYVTVCDAAQYTPEGNNWSAGIHIKYEDLRKPGLLNSIPIYTGPDFGCVHHEPL